MFGRGNDIVTIIRKGDLKKLKAALGKNPNLVEDTIEFAGDGKGNLVQVAAYYNQPALITFLVTEKGMKTTSDNKTPLHFATVGRAYQAVQTLLELGAQPNAKDNNGKTPYEVCNSEAVKALLLPYHKEKLAQEAEARVQGTWTIVSDDEIMFERDLPGNRLHLTDLFNLATKHWTRITENLQMEKLAQETKLCVDPALLEEPRAQMERLLRENNPAGTMRTEPRVADRVRPVI